MLDRPRPTIVTLDDESALAAHLATLVTTCANDAIERHGTFTLVLAGGTTPKAAYALLARPPLSQAVAWSAVRFFFGDERCVPPDNEQSNYRMARDTLLDPLAIDPAAVFRMHGEDDPATAARDYARRLRDEVEASPDGTPVFDLILLGMGTDGHTASLFPGTDPSTDDAQLVRAPYVSKMSSYRLTLTPRVLNAARITVVATAGASKAAALAAVFTDPADAVAYPITILAPTGGELVWLIDRAAAAQLPDRGSLR